MSQAAIYRDAYRGSQRLRRLFRFDVRHRCARIRQLVAERSIQGGRFLDVGFGSGDLLAALPLSVEIVGAEVSASAVARARVDPRFARYAAAEFVQIDEHDPESLPQGPFDGVISSHVIEHVPDDREHLHQILRRLRPGGLLVLFAPIEEPGYNPDHVRTYSVRSLTSLVESAGLEILGVEPSMSMNGHVWKLLTIPSRRRWPVLGPAVNAARLATMCWIPYRLFRAMDRALGAAGVGPRQVFVLARAPERGRIDARG